jgi:hypothetical protein
LGQDTTGENRTNRAYDTRRSSCPVQASLVPTAAQAAPERRKRRKSVFKGSDSEEPHGTRTTESGRTTPRSALHPFHRCPAEVPPTLLTYRKSEEVPSLHRTEGGKG